MESRSVRPAFKALTNAIQKHSLLNDVERDLFKSSFSNSLSDKSSVSDLVSAPSVASLCEALRDSLTTVQDHRELNAPLQRMQTWNPTVAALITALGTLGAPFTTEEIAKSKSRTSAKASPGKAPPKKKSKLVTPEAKKPPSTATIPAEPAEPVHGASSDPAAMQIEVATTSAPEAKSSEKDSAADAIPDQRTQLEIRASISNALVAQGPYVRHIKHACSRAQCSFCRKLLRAVHISKCTAVHQGELCHQSGWWPHVGQQLWRQLRSVHDRGDEFTPRAVLELRAGQIHRLHDELPNLQSPWKRSRFRSFDTISESTQESENSDWNDVGPKSPTYLPGEKPPA